MLMSLLKDYRTWLVLIAIFLPTSIIAGKIMLSAAEQKRLSALAPDVRAKLLELISNMKTKYDISLSIGRTQGSIAATMLNKAEGRSSVSVSWHDLTPPRAVDMYVKGTLGADTKAKDEKSYRLLAIEAEALGFRQIGWNKDGTKRYLSSGAWDPFHLEYRGPYGNIAMAIEATGVKQV